MKKILISLIIVLISGISFIWITYAAEWEWIKVTVTEKIPWANCIWVTTSDAWPIPEEWPYVCTVEPWFWTVTRMMWAMVKYFTFIVWLVWVLFIVFNWIMYSMGWIEQSLKDNAKKKIVQTLIWLTLLLLSWVILNLVAPWIYTA